MPRIRMIRKILSTAKMGHTTAAYLVVFAVCALVIDVFSPEITSYPDALWLCFETMATIGFGDLPTTGFLVRVALVVLSIISIFYLAVVTGVVVAYCNELLKLRANESFIKLEDDLEHLEEKTPEELREISERVKKMRLRV